MSPQSTNGGANASPGPEMKVEDCAFSHPGALSATVTLVDVDGDGRHVLQNVPADEARGGRFRRGATFSWADLGAAITSLRQLQPAGAAG